MNNFNLMLKLRGRQDKGETLSMITIDSNIIIFFSFHFYICCNDINICHTNRNTGCNIQLNQIKSISSLNLQCFVEQILYYWLMKM